MSARAEGFCGSPDTWVYTWKQDRRALRTRGPGPVTIQLRAGSTTEVEVSVADSLGVEIAHASRVLEAPRLRVDLEDSCDKMAASVGAPPPGRLGSLGKKSDVPRKLCGLVRLVARPSDEGGMGILRRGNLLEGITVRWTDLKYTSATTNWAWREIPAASLTMTRGGYDNDTLILKSAMTAPGATEYMRYQAAAEVTDVWRRRAVVNFVGSNDCGEASDLESMLGTLWSAARPGRPLPKADPTGGSAGTDDRARQIAMFLARARSVRAGAGSEAARRREIAEINDLALQAIAQERDLVVPPYPAPIFSLAATPRAWAKQVQQRAQREAVRRLMLEIRTPRRIPRQ